MTPPETLPDEIAVLQTALIAERAARQQAEARASGAEAMVAYLKLLIAKMKRERFGQSAERGRQLLDQLELQLEELEASATEDEVAAGPAEPDPTTVHGFTRKEPVRAPCRLTCRASAWSCRRRVPARVAAAGLSSSARTSPRPSKSCRGNGR
jgi:transposase